MAAAFAISLGLIYIYQFILPKISNNKKILLSILLGVSLGLFFYFHLVALLMTGVIIFLLGLANKDIKHTFIILFIAGIICLPQYLYLTHDSSAYSLMFKPGFLIADTLSIKTFVNYWFANLGLHTVLIVLGLLFANKKQRIFFFAVFVCFLIGNLFQFSPDMAGNHKFFNFVLLFGAMYTSFAIYKMWKEKFPKVFLTLLVFILTFSGILDLFPVINDRRIAIADYNQNQAAIWIITNTPKDSVFLNTDFLYQSPSLAGRKIFLGWPYFAWSAGYDTTQRYEEIKNTLLSNNSSEICSFMARNNLSYLSLKAPTNDFPYDNSLLSDIIPSYRDTSESIFSIDDICKTN